MRSHATFAAVLLAAALVGGANAFPSRFIEIVTYSSLGCNNTATASAAAVYPIDQCFTVSGSTSAQYSVSGSSGLVYATYTDTVCGGTATTVPFASTVSGSGVTCLSAGLSSTQYTVPSTRASSVYGLTFYSDDSCATVSTATFPNPRYTLAGICGSSSSTVMNVFSGSTLQTCSYASAGCSGAADCTDIPNGQCAQTSSGGSYHSAQYSYNASPRAAAASTVAVAALAALVAAVTRHF